MTFDRKSVAEELVQLVAAFTSNGGRGVEMAERIDTLTAQIAEHDRQYDEAFPDSDKLLAEVKALDEAYASADEAEAYDLLAVVQTLRDIVQCFDLSDASQHNDLEIWVAVKAALEQLEPWLEQDEDPRSIGWVDDKKRP